MDWKIQQAIESEPLVFVDPINMEEYDEYNLQVVRNQRLALKGDIGIPPIAGTGTSTSGIGGLGNIENLKF